MAELAGSLDANVLLRLLLNDVPDQHQAVLTLLDTETGQLAVANTAMIELAFVLSRHYGFNRPQIAEAIEGLMNLTNISCNQDLYANALPLFIKHPGLSFEDCCLVSYAKLNNAEPLWTFDKKLASQAASAELVR